MTEIVGRIEAPPNNSGLYTVIYDAPIIDCSHSVESKAMKRAALVVMTFAVLLVILCAVGGVA